MRIFINVIFLILSFCTCTAPKKNTSSAIGVVTLNNYQLNPDVTLNDEINYGFIGNADTFNQRFSMTKSAPGAAIVPNFSSQSVVSIILKRSEKVRTVVINKATIEGENLNVYYTITDTTSFKTYAQVSMAVATVPKSTVKQVNFYEGNIKAKTVVAVY